jgi:hypothetical protein
MPHAPPPAPARGVNTAAIHAVAQMPMMRAPIHPPSSSPFTPTRAPAHALLAPVHMPANMPHLPPAPPPSRTQRGAFTPHPGQSAPHAHGTFAPHPSSAASHYGAAASPAAPHIAALTAATSPATSRGAYGGGGPSSHAPRGATHATQPTQRRGFAMEFLSTGKRTYCPFVSLAVPTGATVDIIVRPQLVFRPDEIIVGATTAAQPFNLTAIKVGVVPQAVAGGEVPTECFPAQNGPKFAFDVADQGTDITMSVKNLNAAAKDFFGILVGDEVYRSG